MCRCVLLPAEKPFGLVRCAVLSLVAFAVLVIAAVVSHAQDAPPPAPLKVGDPLPGTFQPWTFTGKHIETLRRRLLASVRESDDDTLKEDKKQRAAAITGVFHCPISENGLNPVVLVFLKGTNPSPAVLMFLQKLDEAVVKYERQRLAVAVVFLDDAIKDVVKDDEPRTAAATALEPTLKPFASVTASVDSFEALKELFKLNPENDVTIVMYNTLKVIGSKGLLNANFDEKAVEEEIKDIGAKLTGPVPSATPAKDRPPLTEKP